MTTIIHLVAICHYILYMDEVYLCVKKKKRKKSTWLTRKTKTKTKHREGESPEYGQ